MSTTRLFQPLSLGHAQLQSRVVMAPLTRFRADENHVPSEFAKEYYEQRASTAGTLIVTEATFISPRASGYKYAPGIWSEAQIEAWKQITDAVHAKGSFIFSQLWALGRTASADVLQAEGGHPIVSSSANVMPGMTAAGTVPGVPQELSEEQIHSFISDYAQAARNAIRAGFDGVELHGANGYLIDQFTQEVVNQRTDKWGGSIENRSRFAVEVTKAVVAAVGDSSRVAIRLAPWYDGQGMGLKEPIPQYLDLTKRLRELDLAYLHLVERRVGGSNSTDYVFNDDISHDNDALIDAWCTDGKPVVLAGGFTPERATKLLDVARSDKNILIAFGRYFISNPDLVFRIKERIAFTQYDRSTFYKALTPVGYIDQPFSAEWLATHPQATEVKA